MKRKLLLAALCVVGAIGGGNSLMAQTEWSGDITSDSGLDFTDITGFGAPNTSLTVPELWCNNASAAFDFKQSLSSIPDGVYELSVNAMYRASLTYGTETNCVLYATVGENTYSVPIANFGDFNAREDRAGAKGRIAEQIEVMDSYKNKVNVFVEGGNATIGMKSLGSLTYCTNGYWFVWKRSTFGFKDVTSTYHATLITRATALRDAAPDGDAKTALSTAITNYSEASYTNVKSLQSAISTFLETATVGSPINVTSYMANPSFEGGKTKNWIQDLGYKQPADLYQPEGWIMLYSSAVVDNTAYQTFNPQTSGAKDGNCLYVRHRWGNVLAKESIRQAVYDLPNGSYTLKVAVKGTTVTDPNYLKLSAGSNSNTTTVNTFTSDYQDYSVNVIKNDEDAPIVVKYDFDQLSGSEQLYYIDDFRLFYNGDPVKAKKAELEDLQATITDEAYFTNADYANVVGTERTNLTDAKTATAAEETVEAYEAAITSVQKAIDAFIAAKTNYDALVAEIVKAKALGIVTATADGYAATASSTAATALTSTQNLKVAEYNYVTTTYQYGVDLGTWTTTGPTGSKQEQHYKGSGSDYKYLEQSQAAWGSGSWTIKYEQNLNLPAGNYVFKVAGRKAASDGVTMNLEVKQGETTLGTVSDFPEGDTGLGINKDGATDFTTGEGHEYVNNGAGRGWEWRYVKFTLASDATVNVAVNAKATKSQMWVSFCDATVQTDDDANISLIAYNIALNSAQTVIEDAAYTNVTGSEKIALQDAIAADVSLDKTSATAIDDATETLDNARTAFTGAKDAYDAYVTAKNAAYTELPYASATKFAVIAAAQGAAAATSASDATTKTNAILSAYRLYVESNALAEGVYGKENKTDLITDPNFAGVSVSGTSAGAWTFDQTGGSANINSNESFTDGEGNSNYNYFDYYNGSNNNQNVHQVIEALEPGRYILSATGRGHTNFNDNLQLYVVNKGSVKIPAIGNTGGTFDRGWNDVTLAFDQTETSNVTIGAKTDNGKKEWWGVTRFRLVKIADIKKSSDELEGYKTFYNADYNYEVDGKTTIYIAKVPNSGDDYVTIIPVAGKIVPKETPVILWTEADDYTITLTPTTAEATATFSGNALQVASENGTVDNAYVLGYLNDAENGGLGFYKYEASLDAGDVYLTVNGGNAPARMSIIADGEATAINSVKAEAGKANDATYNMAGQRVNGSYKGIVIKNGKKYMIK